MEALLAEAKSKFEEREKAAAAERATLSALEVELSGVEEEITALANEEARLQEKHKTEQGDLKELSQENMKIQEEIEALNSNSALTVSLEKLAQKVFGGSAWARARPAQRMMRVFPCDARRSRRPRTRPRSTAT